MRIPKLILVPTDFSDRANAALDYAAALASKLDAKICLVNIVGAQLVGMEYGFPMTAAKMEETCARHQDQLDQLIAAHDEISFLPPVLTTGDPRTEIERIARELGADLIVMATHGRRGLARLAMGSVAEALVRVAPCPVLLVREILS